ncbi:hypothetical protein T265_05244 [Opisthorchis viverrini]|uniref:Uncharacterized protein n=1 Tax=Opisthorchis viverrini TaxID=6198 RepID=A0A075AFH8_OPIVI|nr:hypothetical protein T265_05244 [Opisthorchis viverrini]KER27754.1 hypothetical protein T265_05244 [Opisthorchis viverrini]
MRLPSAKCKVPLLAFSNLQHPWRRSDVSLSIRAEFALQWCDPYYFMDQKRGRYVHRTYGRCHCLVTEVSNALVRTCTLHARRPFASEFFFLIPALNGSDRCVNSVRRGNEIRKHQPVNLLVSATAASLDVDPGTQLTNVNVGARWRCVWSADSLTERSVVRTRPLPLDFPCLGFSRLAVSKPSCHLLVARQLGTEWIKCLYTGHEMPFDYDVISRYLCGVKFRRACANKLLENHKDYIVDCKESGTEFAPTSGKYKNASYFKESNGISTAELESDSGSPREPEHTELSDEPGLKMSSMMLYLNTVKAKLPFTDQLYTS